MRAFLRAHWLVLTVAVSCLVIGTALGSSTQPEAKVVTKTDTVTQTKTVNVEVTPKSCETTIDGLLEAGKISNRAAAHAVTAAVNQDAAGISAQVDDIKRSTRIINHLRAPYADCLSRTAS